MEVFVVVVVVFDGNDFLVIGIVFYSTNLLRSLITRRIGERFLCPTIFSTIAAVTAGAGTVVNGWRKYDISCQHTGCDCASRNSFPSD